MLDLGFPDSSVGKESACNAGDPGLIPGLGRSPGEGNGKPLQYSGLEVPWTEEPVWPLLQKNNHTNIFFLTNGCVCLPIECCL